jgi:acyl-coenzyme A thioesterase PaaI-like protein
VSESFFDRIEPGPDGVRAWATQATTGPWSPRFQHGGPPSALVVRTAEQVAATATGRTDLIALRLAAEFVGPVPVGEVSVTARVVRSARSASLVEATLAASGRICLTGRVWLLAAEAPPEGVVLTAPGEVPDRPMLWGALSFPYSDQVDWRAVSGAAGTPGPAVVWARPRIPLVAQEPLSGLQRAVLLADSGSGVSAELDWATWSFMNVDLDVHLSRPLSGEWVRLDARTTLGTTGAALTSSTLADLRGTVGAALQTLVLRRTT